MSGHVLAIVPRGQIPEDAGVPAGCHLVGWRSAEDILRALGEARAEGATAIVLLADGLEDREMRDVVTAVRHTAAPVFAVRSEQWDGFTAWPLAGACRGAISGFGVDGARAAARALAP
jgi:hypothetical protein